MDTFILGSQHSGTFEDDFNTSNDLDNSHSGENNNEINQRNQDDDEDGIDCRCFLCDRDCGDVDM